MIAYWTVLCCAVFRVAVVWSGLLVMSLNRRRKIQWHASMLIAFPEPFLLAGVVYWLVQTWEPASNSMIAKTALALGALSAIGSVLLFCWSFLAYRNVGTGHYVDENHRVVTEGPYSLVRHPFYTSALMCWAGVVLATGNIWIAALFGFYVIPAYWYYAASEERMMCSELGDQYETYRQSVPMFVPRPGAGRRGAP